MDSMELRPAYTSGNRLSSALAAVLAAKCASGRGETTAVKPFAVLQRERKSPPSRGERASRPRSIAQALPSQPKDHAPTGAGLVLGRRSEANHTSSIRIVRGYFSAPLDRRVRKLALRDDR